MSDLAQRMEALLAEARREGRLAELSEPLLAATEELRRLEAARVEGELPSQFGMIGAAPALKTVFELIERVAPSDVPVLIQGETGTGKELVARALHEHSRRKSKPFLAENCAEIGRASCRERVSYVFYI